MARDSSMGVSSKRKRNGNGRSRKRVRKNPQSRRLNARTAGFLGIELKFYDTFLVNAALTTTTDMSGGEHNPSGTIALNTVVQGEGENQRDGRKMIMKSISVNGLIGSAPQTNETAADPGATILVALVWDKQTNGALLNSENVYVNPSGANVGAVLPYRNLQYISRFKVLASRQMQMPIPTLTWDGTNMEQGGVQHVFRFDLKLPDIPVTFSANTETIANIIDNSLHVIAFTTGAGTVPLLSYNARLRFVG